VAVAPATTTAATAASALVAEASERGLGVFASGVDVFHGAADFIGHGA
jgi:hypothetical protein